MARMKTKNPVRFAWWGAEELGLLGAEHYVADLKANDPEAFEKIGLYLNFDMVGSPNYVRFVYDGDNSTGGADEAGPEGSGEIEQVFSQYFASQGLESEETPFNGRSDYGPFIAEGIPAGGLFTGAEGIKTAEQAAVYGGQAGVAYDKCYHSECDDITNISFDAIDEMSDAVAHALYTYAKPTRGWGHDDDDWDDDNRDRDDDDRDRDDDDRDRDDDDRDRDDDRGRGHHKHHGAKHEGDRRR
jgi:Zn-dependent M28 family amino/carboxypeptidase